jgi:hypothetical protein
VNNEPPTTYGYAMAMLDVEEYCLSLAHLHEEKALGERVHGTPGEAEALMREGDVLRQVATWARIRARGGQRSS